MPPGQASGVGRRLARRLLKMKHAGVDGRFIVESTIRRLPGAVARAGRPGGVDGDESRIVSSGTGGKVIKVRPRGNESIHQMLKRFKRLCQREGLTRDMKRNSYYEKPSERRRRKARKSQRRQAVA